jgi:two-component system sensor histidine kinase/response regulator
LLTEHTLSESWTQNPVPRPAVPSTAEETPRPSACTGGIGPECPTPKRYWRRASDRLLTAGGFDVRTPLHTIIGALALLQRTGLTDRQSRYVQMAKAASDTILALLSDADDYRRARDGRLQLDAEPVDLHELCKQITAVVLPQAQARGVHISCEAAPDVPRNVIGDAVRLRQILLNLTWAALRFTVKGGIAIRAVLDRREGEEATVRFVVSDSGCGVPADRIERLFRAIAESVDAGDLAGPDMGLALCKHLVSLMNGQIGVASEPGRGTTFWFTARLIVQAGEQETQPVDLRSLRHFIFAEDGEAGATIADVLIGLGLDCQLLTRPDALYDAVGRAVESRATAVCVVLAVSDTRRAGDLAQTLINSPNGPSMIVVASVPTSPTPAEALQLRTSGVSAVLDRPTTEDTVIDALSSAMAAWHRSLDPVDIDHGTSMGRLIAERRGVRVLIAEDDDVNQIIASELLKEAGCSVVSVGDGRHAVEEVLSGRHDVVLMDCQMPVMDGIEATRTIRRAEAERGPLGRDGSPIRIIALTASSEAIDRDRCMQAGMDGHLMKPLESSIMTEAIVAVLQSSRRAA